MLRNRKRQLVSCGVRKQKGNGANRKGGLGPRVWEGRRLTGPWERWRATGKGRTEGRGAEEGAAAVIVTHSQATAAVADRVLRLTATGLEPHAGR